MRWLWIPWAAIFLWVCECVCPIWSWSFICTHPLPFSSESIQLQKLLPYSLKHREMCKADSFIISLSLSGLVRERERERLRMNGCVKHMEVPERLEPDLLTRHLEKEPKLQGFWQHIMDTSTYTYKYLSEWVHFQLPNKQHFVVSTSNHMLANKSCTPSLIFL